VVEQGLRDGKLVIVDLSLMRGMPATSTAAMLLRYIFEYNVREHTRANGTPYAVIALIEEAQKVLEGGDTSHAPFIEWVKEGRKYGLGNVLVTQQPSAIDEEILSQTDNFFVFHLLSKGDLNKLAGANGHFSEDILATLLNEPIEGQGVFWSSAGRDKTTYPIPFRAFNFGDLFKRLPESEARNAPDNYAAHIAAKIPPGDAPDLGSVPQPAATFGKRFPNQAELKPTDRANAQKVQGDQAMARDLSRNEFPLFVIENWLRNNGRKNAVQASAIAIITVLFGLYGIGWELITKRTSAGRAYEAIRKLDPAEGRRRLEHGDDPLLSDDAGAQGAGDGDDTSGDVQ
jgi:hypothetical protein